MAPPLVLLFLLLHEHDLIIPMASLNTEREVAGSLSMGRGFGAMVNLNGNIYIIGGENHPTVVERFDYEHEIFPLVPSYELIHGRSRFGYTAVPSSIFDHIGCTHV